MMMVSSKTFINFVVMSGLRWNMKTKLEIERMRLARKRFEAKYKPLKKYPNTFGLKPFDSFEEGKHGAV